MDDFQILSLIIAIISLFMSGGALYVSGRASNINKRIFKRQGVIDLHMAWQNVSDIDPKNLVGPDVIKAVNALSLTASLWNHDVIEKSILYQAYWGAYKDLYDKLINLDEIVPGHKRTCRSLITAEIQKAYESMKTTDLQTVQGSTL